MLCARLVIAFVFAVAGSVPAFGQTVIPRGNWSVHNVDSQEASGNYAASNVYDGSASTLWVTQWSSASPPPPHDLQINLGATYTVSGFRYLPRQDGVSYGNIGQYQLYVSTDGVNWGTAVASGTFPNSSAEQQVTFAAKSGRYIRLRALTEVDGHPWTAVAELNVLSSGSGGGSGGSSGSVISRGNWLVHNVDSQDASGNFAASNVYDGSADTLWVTQWSGASPPPPHDLQINLGATYTVSGFRYLPRQDGISYGSIGQYQFYVSTDGVNWGTAVASGTFPHASAEQEVTFAAKSGRYIRLRALTEVDGHPWTAVAELNVLSAGTSAPTQPPSGTITAPASNVTITAGQSVSFAGSGSDPDNNLPLAYAWSFGSGGPAASTSQNPGSVVFPNAGVYTVTFTVTDALGAVDPTPATRTITVQSGSGGSSGSVISRGNWSVHNVDSQDASGNFAASNVYDGSASTLWVTQWSSASPPPPHDLQINLGATYTVSGFRYLPRQDGISYGSIGQYQFYVSTDGVTWGTAVASGTFPNSSAEQQITFAAKSGRYIRLRALTEVEGHPWTAVAELNVLGSQSGSTNQFPQVSLTANYNAAAGSVSLAATASDPDGSVVRVDFYADSTLIRTDTSAPYSATASSVVPGTHAFMAAAEDNAGDRTASNTVLITVGGSTPPPSHAVFTASADHDTLVERYVLKVYSPQANPLTATPLVTADLGKPGVVNGECDVNIGGVLSALAPGSYIATVSAVGSGGESQSSPSPPFVNP